MLRFTIKRRLGITFLVLIALLAMGGAAGYFGIQKLSATLDFITHKAWDAADGGMETVIGLQGQIIVLNAMARNEGDLENRRAQLADFERLERQATRRMLDSGLLDSAIILPYKRLHARYEQTKTRLLSAIDSGEPAAIASSSQHFKASTDRLISFLYGMEEAADGAVENEAHSIASAQNLAFMTLGLALLVGLVVAGVAYLTSVQFIVKPIETTADRLHDIARGNGGLSARLTPRGNDEVTDLVNAFNLFAGKLENTVAQDPRGPAPRGAGEMQPAPDRRATTHRRRVRQVTDPGAPAGPLKPATTGAERAADDIQETRRELARLAARLNEIAQRV